MVEKKPPRMRAACGQCHAAKVKCSGEKTGCTRCSKLGLACEYGISMVGRASKKKYENENEDVAMGEGSEDSGLPLTDSNSADAFTLPGVDGDGLDFNFAPQDFLSITGLNDFSFHAFPDNMPSDISPLPGLSTGTSSVTSQDGSSPSTTANARYSSRGHLHPSHPPDHQRDQQQAEGVATAPSDPHKGAKPNFITEPMSLSTLEASRISATESYEPLFCLARLVYYLENHMATGAKQPLDKTLSVVKSALRELMELVKWEGCMSSYGCRALVFAVLTLIVKLYSHALARFRAGYKGPPDAYMKLGSFEVDPEDQWRLQNMMIASELGRCVQIIKIMAKEQTNRCERGTECGGAKNFECLAETATQMKTTLERESVHDKRMVHPLI